MEPSPTQDTTKPRVDRRIVVAAAVVVVIGAGIAIASLTLGHHADTGLSGCQAVKAEIVHKTGGNAYTSAIYQQQRGWFHDSKFTDLRQAGTAYVDEEWQSYQEVRHGDATAVDYGALVRDQAALTAACANHGTSLPQPATSD